ncbi:sugar-transfer associated ATP-grasp domain-containing protein [Gulosibacter bifidus]|uniref:Sugar-transfer associated ATP-grasp domain-containing protein n=1 Tax=Gulosibacter bifidus TaxID=272239 RepID=A0ABW5RFW5_9MICO|nr:sugar-transfer associated ATP-grasp domain-containing protein [Gulosibacter bifidus]
MSNPILAKLAFYAERAARLSPANLAAFARQSKPITRKPTPVIIADMLWCSVRHELGFRDYAMWEFASLNARERKTWMTHPKSHLINERYNDEHDRKLFSDKLAFYQRFDDLLGRAWIDARSATDAEFAAFIAEHPQVVVKPFDGHGGAGVAKRDFTDVTDAAALRAELLASNQSLVEACIEQHPELARLHPQSVNTIRIIGFNKGKGDFRLLAAVLRIGCGDAVDNFASGGMYTMLDEHGTALYPGVNKNGEVFATHPLTNEQIAGFQVPHFEEIMTMLEDAASRIPSVPYVGWDVAVTEHGPLIIEGNHNSSVFQAKPSVSGSKIGLLPHYQRQINGA